LRYNNSTPHRRLAPAVAAMWRDRLGAPVTLRNGEGTVLVAKRRQGVITQAFRGGLIAAVVDDRDLLRLCHSGGANSWSGFAGPGFEALLAQADAAATLEERAAALQAAEARLLQAHALVPLCFYTSKQLVRPEVEGFEANPLDRHPSRFLRLRD